jgi:Tol biopolymer transport system component
MGNTLGAKMMTPTSSARRSVGIVGAAIFVTLTFVPGPAAAQTPVNGEIAFSKNRLKGNQIDIYTVDQGGVETRLIRDGNFSAWSPGSTSIAFVRETRKGGRDTFTQQAGARKAEQLTFGPADDVSPDWSPDGNRIVWSSDNDIWVMDVADPTTAHSVVDEGSSNSPTWTPDGRIVYSTNRAGDGTFNIHVVNANGTADLQLTGETLDKADETKPHSNGDHIVYARRPWFQADTDIWRTDPLGVEEELLFGTWDWNEDHPRWSPDGTKIAFECDLNKDFDSDICIMSSIGGGATTVTGVGLDARPDWGAA